MIVQKSLLWWRKIGFPRKVFEIHFWMPAPIQHKEGGSQQVSAALKGTNSPHLVQPKKGFVLQNRQKPLSCHQEGHLSTPSCKVGACVPMAGAGRTSRWVSIHVKRQLWILADNPGPVENHPNYFLPGPLWSPVSSFHLCILVVTNWIHLSRWCSSNYPGSKFPWRVTSEGLFTPVKHIWSVTFPLVTPGIVLIFLCLLLHWFLTPWTLQWHCMLNNRILELADTLELIVCWFITLLSSSSRWSFVKCFWQSE